MKINEFITFGIVSMLAACTTVEPIAYAPAIPAAQCNVVVFQTENQARKRGEFEELCVINATSSMSFSHTVKTAIDKHKDKACECGATHAYIQSRATNPEGVASVTLIGIRYLQKAQ